MDTNTASTLKKSTKTADSFNMKPEDQKHEELNRDIKRTTIFCKAMLNLADDFSSIDYPAEAILHLCKMRDFLNDTLPPEVFQTDDILANPDKWLETTTLIRLRHAGS